MDKLAPSQLIGPCDCPNGPSKIIVLKLRVSDHSLAAGRFRAVASTPVLDPKPHRRRRGRPRNASLLAAAIAAQNSIIELERQRPRSLCLSDFRSLSTYSFPLLIHTPKPRQPPDQYTSAFPTSSASEIAALCPMTPCQNLDLQPTYDSSADVSTGKRFTTPRLNKGPNTMDFWWDSAIAEQAMNSNDVDFKMICLNLMRWKNQNTVPHPPTLHEIAWEVVLDGAVARGKMWRRARRRKESQRERTAGWAVWETRKRSESRGRLVRDGPRGAWVLHSPGTDGKVVKVLRLGYKRQGRSRRDGLFDTDIADHWVDLEELRDTVSCGDMSELAGRG